MYGDLLGRFPCGILSDWGSFPGLLGAALSSPYSRTLLCHTCESECLVPLAQVLVAGIPCTDWSPSGLQRGLQGPTAPVLAGFLREVLQSQPELVILENVLEFDQRPVVTVLGDVYWIIEFPPVRTCHCGFGLVRRDRLYLALVHKQKAKLCCDMSGLYTHVTNRLMQEIPATRPADALVATDAELQEDFINKCSARGIPIEPDTKPWDVLNDREKKAVATYDNLYFERWGGLAAADINLFEFLGDDPSRRVSWSAASNCLPTLRTNAGVFWHPFSQSWLVGQELLAAMGFPVYPEMAAAMHTETVTLDANGCRKALGNCMHLGCAYLVLLCALSSVQMCPAREGQ